MSPAPRKRRFSAKAKMEVVLRLLKGEDLDSLSRETQRPAAEIAQWRDDFLAGGELHLKAKPADPAQAEIARLQQKIGEITMDNELLLERARRLEAKLPLAKRRRRK